jgi:hypothetical protein
VFGEKMQLKSLFLGAAGIAAVTALSGCSTGSVKGELDVPYALSTSFSSANLGDIADNIAPTELELEINAKVNVSLANSQGAPNASGEVELKDENLDLEFEGKICYGFVEGGPTSSVAGLSTEINNALGANIVPAFDNALVSASGNSNNTLRLAGFLGELEGEDDDDDNNSSNGLFVVVLADFPTVDLAQLVGGNAKPVTKFVGFAALDFATPQGYIAAGFANKGKLKWNIVPPVNN